MDRSDAPPTAAAVACPVRSEWPACLPPRRWHAIAWIIIGPYPQAHTSVAQGPAGFVLHSLRDTFGTHQGESGTADAFAIMRLMGHASALTNQRHCHPAPEALERAVRRMENSGAHSFGVTTVFTTGEADLSGTGLQKSFRSF